MIRVGNLVSKIALTCLGTDITFKQYERMAKEFAAYLQNNLGVKKGDSAIMLPNVIQFPVALYGALKIGAICVNTSQLLSS